MPVKVVEDLPPAQVPGNSNIFRNFHMPVLLDCGAVQPDALTVDRLASLEKAFSGTQNVSSNEAWRVNVIIQGCDFEHGYLCGTMEALNAPLRWKEQYFVNTGKDCGLTVAGFYYVCFSCGDGSITGFYYDPNCSPFQKLELKATCEGRSGFSISSSQLQ